MTDMSVPGAWDVLLAMGPAVRLTLNRCTVPVVETDGKQSAVLCTATPFEIGGRRLLVTAGHAIPALERAGRLGTPGDRGIYYWTPTARIWHAIDTAPYDVGIIEFESEEGWAPIKQRFTPLTLDNVYAGQRENGRFVIAGFPAAAVDATLRSQVENPLLLGTDLYTGSDAQATRGIDFLLGYPDALYDQSWRPQPVPRLQGMSGASVWVLTTENRTAGGVWSPESTVKIAGIQVSAAHGRFLRVVNWAAVGRCIVTHCPELSEEIDAWYARGRRLA